MTTNTTPTNGSDTTPTTVLRPGDHDYDRHRLGFQSFAPHEPAAVVVARSADDVVRAVRLARAEGRRLAVQATGHGVGATDRDAVLVDTSGLGGVAVDPVARTARVGAGVRWGEVIDAAARHGLAPLSGSSPGVGVVGYLLSGGVPILGRSRGYAATTVRSLEVVTAAGERRTVDGPDDELGWALRGGGGSFAVVTAITVGLIELDVVHAGSLFLPVHDVDDMSTIVTRWRDWASAVDEHTSTSLAIVPFPDRDGVPGPLRGRTAAAVRFAYDGPVERGRHVAAQLATLGAPLLNGLADIAWTDSAAIHRDPPGPAPSVSTNVLLDALCDDAIAAGVASVGATSTGAPRRVLEIRRAGGALTTPTGLPTPVPAEWSLGTVTIVGEPRDADTAAVLDARLRERLAPGTVGRAANFLFGEGADPDAVRSAYGEQDWTRLRTVRSTVDPDQLLLANAPIPAA